MEVQKVRCLVARGGSMIGMQTVDMVEFAGGHYAVFEWEETAEGKRRPRYMAALDERFLQSLPDGDAEATHQYRVSLEDPRSGF